MSASLAKKKAPPLIRDGRQVRVLLVDDDDFIAGVYSMSLRKAGIEVLLANDGKEGIEAAKKAEPDLILLDLLMPHMDGFEVLTRLRAISSLDQTPIIILSTMSSSQEQVRTRDLGANGFLNKAQVLPDDCLSVVLKTLGIKEGG